MDSGLKDEVFPTVVTPKQTAPLVAVRPLVLLRQPTLTCVDLLSHLGAVEDQHVAELGIVLTHQVAAGDLHTEAKQQLYRDVPCIQPLISALMANLMFSLWCPQSIATKFTPPSPPTLYPTPHPRPHLAQHTVHHGKQLGVNLSGLLPVHKCVLLPALNGAPDRGDHSHIQAVAEGAWQEGDLGFRVPGRKGVGV